jgi:RimJ/RimL family protein N-acetyltransferase
MLRYAFDELGCIRVQFQTDVLNERSQAAIVRLDATREGVARNERIMPDGRKRDTVCFSIIDEEWPKVRRNLEAKLDGHASFTVLDPG